MQPKKQLQCKFGDNCKHLAQGNCNFYHYPGQPRQGQGQGQGQSMENRFATNFNGPRGPNQQFGNYQNTNQNNYQQGGNNGGWGTQHGNYGKSFNQPDLNNKNYKNSMNLEPGKGDDFVGKYCRSYQYNQQCKFQQKGKCIRVHGFDEQGKIKRVIYSNQIPPMEPSRLGKFIKDGQTYLILRMGNAVALLTYDYQTSKFSNQGNWQFPNSELGYEYYNQKQNFIYLAIENPKTYLHDIMIYDILTDKLISLVEAHQAIVTDIVHFNPDIILSSSKDGTIKVFKVNGNGLVLDSASSDHLLQTYSIIGKTVEILFLDFSIVNGNKILAAGTNDNRILFYLGDQMQYYPLVLTEQHTKTYKIKYCKINEDSVALATTWNQDNTSSSLIAINLNNFQVVPLITQTLKQHPKNMIYFIEIIQEKLYVVSMQGTILIYNLSTMKKMGLMLHKNSVNSIVPSEYITKTNIRINQIFVLQSKYNEKPGSIGVYVVKP